MGKGNLGRHRRPDKTRERYTPVDGQYEEFKRRERDDEFVEAPPAKEPYTSASTKDNHGFNPHDTERQALKLLFERTQVIKQRARRFGRFERWYMVRYSPARHCSYTKLCNRKYTVLANDGLGVFFLAVHPEKLIRDFADCYVVPPANAASWTQREREEYTIQVRDKVVAKRGNTRVTMIGDAVTARQIAQEDRANLRRVAKLVAAEKIVKSTPEVEAALAAQPSTKTKDANKDTRARRNRRKRQAAKDFFNSEEALWPEPDRVPASLMSGPEYSGDVAGDGAASSTAFRSSLSPPEYILQALAEIVVDPRRKLDVEPYDDGSPVYCPKVKAWRFEWENPVSLMVILIFEPRFYETSVDCGYFHFSKMKDVIADHDKESDHQYNGAQGEATGTDDLADKTSTVGRTVGISPAAVKELDRQKRATDAAARRALNEMYKKIGELKKQRAESKATQPASTTAVAGGAAVGQAAQKDSTPNQSSPKAPASVPAVVAQVPADPAQPEPELDSIEYDFDAMGQDSGDITDVMSVAQRKGAIGAAKEYAALVEDRSKLELFAHYSAQGTPHESDDVWQAHSRRALERARKEGQDSALKILVDQMKKETCDALVAHATPEVARPPRPEPTYAKKNLLVNRTRPSYFGAMINKFFRGLNSVCCSMYDVYASDEVEGDTMGEIKFLAVDRDQASATLGYNAQVAGVICEDLLVMLDASKLGGAAKVTSNSVSRLINDSIEIRNNSTTKFNTEGLSDLIIHNTVAHYLHRNQVRRAQTDALLNVKEGVPSVPWASFNG